MILYLNILQPDIILSSHNISSVIIKAAHQALQRNNFCCFAKYHQKSICIILSKGGSFFQMVYKMANVQKGDITLAEHRHSERKAKVKLIIANNQQAVVVSYLPGA